MVSSAQPDCLAECKAGGLALIGESAEQ